MFFKGTPSQDEQKPILCRLMTFSLTFTGLSHLSGRGEGSRQHPVGLAVQCTLYTVQALPG
jgi:hypothetical protein